MPKNIIQTERDRYSYIPPDARNVMDEHLKSFMPAHLQSYINTNSSGYIPEGMKTTIKKELDRNLPAHLRGYSDAYIEQSIVSPIISKQARDPRQPNAHPPTPDVLRRDHSIPVGEQHTVELSSLPLASKSMFASDPVRSNASPSQSQIPPQPALTPNPNEPNFDFILNPNPTINSKRKLPGISGFSPNLNKVLFALGGLTFLVIVLVLLANVFKSSSNLTPLETVTADQQELIHIITGANQQQNIDQSDQTLLATANIVLTSNQTQLFTYLTSNGDKVSTKILNSRISVSVDQSLTLAQTNGNYDQVLDQELSSHLQTYMHDIVLAYNSLNGPKGRALLKSEYNQANLLQTQLSSTTNS